MIPIYICEDNNSQLNQLENLIKNIIFIEDYDMHIKCATQNPYDILNHLKPDMPVGIYFFDIDLDFDLNGIELAELIRQHDAIGYIIFITSYTNMWRLTFDYKISALDFIDKSCVNEIPSRIASCLSCAWNHYSKTNASFKKTIPLRINGKLIFHDIDKLLYIEASHNPHRVILHSEIECLDVSGDLKDFEKELPTYFIRSHRSYIINLLKVSFIDASKNMIIFINKESCPVSIRKKQIVKESLYLHQQY